VERLVESLIAAIEDGLPLTARPYAAVAERLGVDEQTVLEMLRELIETGVIKRLGVVVRHHELGYRANAMVVWDVPDERVGEIGARLASEPEVTLCYRRPSRAGIEDLDYRVLFSRRRFKQNGARYARVALDERAVANG